MATNQALAAQGSQDRSSSWVTASATTATTREAAGDVSAKRLEVYLTMQRQYAEQLKLSHALSARLDIMASQAGLLQDVLVAALVKLHGSSKKDGHKRKTGGDAFCDAPAVQAQPGCGSNAAAAATPIGQRLPSPAAAAATDTAAVAASGYTSSRGPSPPLVAAAAPDFARPRWLYGVYGQGVNGTLSLPPRSPFVDAAVPAAAASPRPTFVPLCSVAFDPRREPASLVSSPSCAGREDSERSGSPSLAPSLPAAPPSDGSSAVAAPWTINQAALYDTTTADDPRSAVGGSGNGSGGRSALGRNATATNGCCYNQVRPLCEYNSATAAATTASDDACSKRLRLEEGSVAAVRLATAVSLPTLPFQSAEPPEWLAALGRYGAQVLTSQEYRAQIVAAPPTRACPQRQKHKAGRSVGDGSASSSKAAAKQPQRQGQRQGPGQPPSPPAPPLPLSPPAPPRLYRSGGGNSSSAAGADSDHRVGAVGAVRVAPTALHNPLMFSPSYFSHPHVVQMLQLQQLQGQVRREGSSLSPPPFGAQPGSGGSNCAPPDQGMRLSTSTALAAAVTVTSALTAAAPAPMAAPAATMASSYGMQVPTGTAVPAVRDSQPWWSHGQPSAAASAQPPPLPPLPDTSAGSNTAAQLFLFGL